MEASWSGEVALFDYTQLDIVKDRSDAFRKELASFPEMKLVAEDLAVKRDESLPMMEVMLQAHPNIKGVYAINDGAGFGAYYASVAAGKGVIVAAGDGEGEGIELVGSGSNNQLNTSHFTQMLGQLAATTADTILDCCGRKLCKANGGQSKHHVFRAYTDEVDWIDAVSHPRMPYPLVFFDKYGTIRR